MNNDRTPSFSAEAVELLQYREWDGVADSVSGSGVASSA